MRIGDTAGEQIGVIGEDADALAAAGDGDVKLFAVDGGEGARRGDQEDFIHGLALGGMRRDGVTMRECPVVGWENSTVGQSDGPAGEAPDLDTLAVDEV